VAGHGHGKPGRQPTSRALAVLVAVANLVICGVALATVTASTGPAAGAREEPGWLDARPGSRFARVTGPGGLTTSVPAGWPVGAAAEPDAMRADDPAGTTTELRFGRTATTDTDGYAARAACARTLAAQGTGYVPVRLVRTVVRGKSAVDWEYEYDTADGRRHVRSVHWWHDGYEYFVRASSPVRRWPDTRKVLDVMLTYSTP
jgi:hypothetical protein